MLLEIGGWLDQFGEAVYNTSPWIIYGEGPTSQPEGHFKNHSAFQKLVYSNKDLRYTTNGNTIYVTIFGWPDGQNVLLKSFGKSVIDGDMKVTKASLIGYDGEIEWKQTDEGLSLSVPATPVNDMANVYKLETTGKAKLK